MLDSFYKYNCVIFCFSTNPVTSHGSSSNAHLCNSREETGVELCPVFNSPASTFYIRVHSYKAHQTGNLNITGTNLLQVFVTGSGGLTPAALTTLGTYQFNLRECP